MKPKGLIYKGCKTTTGGVEEMCGFVVAVLAIRDRPACKVGKGDVVSDHKLKEL